MEKKGVKHCTLFPNSYSYFFVWVIIFLFWFLCYVVCNSACCIICRLVYSFSCIKLPPWKCYIGFYLGTGFRVNFVNCWCWKMLQIRGMHTLIRDQEITKHDFVFYSDRLIRLVTCSVAVWNPDFIVFSLLMLNILNLKVCNNFYIRLWSMV